MANDYVSEEAVARYLASLEPGFLPRDIFLQFARLMTIAVIELVPLRLRDDKVEVLLVQRPDDDTWAGMWHVPGTLIRPTDKMETGNDYEEPLQRLLGPDGELGGVTTAAQPVEVETERRRVKRGDELAVIHYVEVTGEPVKGQFFPLDGYPENVPPNGVVPHHVDFVRRAAQQFLADKHQA
jgi:8-oxo-dGTP pyrophosphatase MutT (NUDIX family)